MSYNNSHRALLQAVIARGAVSTTDARELIVKLFQQNESTFSYMHQINVQLEPLNMTIKNVACELTGQKYWILVSTLLDETARFQTKFSPAELELLRKMFNDIITSAEGCVPSTMCLNLSSTLENRMSKAEAEDFLTFMVDKKWFVSRHGSFYMGVRSIAELIPYFKSTYADDVLNTCSFCRQTVFHGKRCLDCHQVLHLVCYANSASVQNPPKCPSCGEMMDMMEYDQDFQISNDHTLNLPEVDLAETNSEPVEVESKKRSAVRKRKQTSR